MSEEGTYTSCAQRAPFARHGCVCRKPHLHAGEHECDGYEEGIATIATTVVKKTHPSHRWTGIWLMLALLLTGCGQPITGTGQTLPSRLIPSFECSGKGQVSFMFNAPVGAGSAGTTFDCPENGKWTGVKQLQPEAVKP